MTYRFCFYRDGVMLSDDTDKMITVNGSSFKESKQKAIQAFNQQFPNVLFDKVEQC